MTVLGIIGTISNPVTGYGDFTSATTFLSNIIRLLTTIAGIYAFINFVIAGIEYISAAGNPEGISKAWKRIYQSIIGLVVVVLAFAFAALLGWLLYANPTAILLPRIYGPGP